MVTTLIFITNCAQKIIVVDFEYAGPNPASYDIANHFHEWTADYHSPTPHLYDPSRYPTYDQRRNFYIAYLAHTGEGPVMAEPDRELQLANLEEQVRVWSPASHAMWAIWGIVQARDDLKANVTEPEFDYIGYSICRMTSFRREILALGIQSLASQGDKFLGNNVSRNYALSPLLMMFSLSLRVPALESLLQ